MSKTLHLIAALLLALFVGHADAASPYAPAVATMDSYCVPSGLFARRSTPWYSSTRCSEDWSSEISDRLRVTITPVPEDAVLPGNFYIALRTEGRVTGTFTLLAPEQWQGAGIDQRPNTFNTGTDVGTWVEYRGGMLEPVLLMDQIGGAQTFTVLDKMRLCALTGVGTFELWAGYGVLQPDFQSAIAYYQSAGNPNISPAHLRNVYIQRDMSTANKYWKVWEQTCTETDVNPPKNDSGS